MPRSTNVASPSEAISVSTLIGREEAIIRELQSNVDAPRREELQQEVSQIRRALRLLGVKPHPDIPEDHPIGRSPSARRNRSY